VNRRQRVPRREPDSADELMNHSAKMGGVFCVLILVAVGIEIFSRVLIYAGLVQKFSFIYWAMYWGARALVAIDVVAFLAVVVKKAIKMVKKA
jgi:hypothetical protein